MCGARLLDCVNDLKNFPQVNGFSPEWVFWWHLREHAALNDWEHSLQENGFLPEWVLKWDLRLPAWLNLYK